MAVGKHLRLRSALRPSCSNVFASLSYWQTNLDTAKGTNGDDVHNNNIEDQTIRERSMKNVSTFLNLR